MSKIKSARPGAGPLHPLALPLPSPGAPGTSTAQGGLGLGGMRCTQGAAYHILRPRCLRLALSFCRSCYLNSAGFQGEGQQPPRRALQSDGLRGQTGWRPPCVIDGEKELKVRMAPIHALALSV